MKKIQAISLLLLVSAAVTTMTGCAPEIGSEAWCKQMQEKDKGDWSANEAADFAKHCLFK